MPELGGLFRGRFHAAMADASVRRQNENTSEATLRAAVTRNGGDALGPD